MPSPRPRCRGEGGLRQVHLRAHPALPLGSCTAQRWPRTSARTGRRAHRPAPTVRRCPDQALPAGQPGVALGSLPAHQRRSARSLPRSRAASPRHAVQVEHADSPVVDEEVVGLEVSVEEARRVALDPPARGPRLRPRRRTADRPRGAVRGRARPRAGSSGPRRRSWSGRRSTMEGPRAARASSCSTRGCPAHQGHVCRRLTRANCQDV